MILSRIGLFLFIAFLPFATLAQTDDSPGIVSDTEEFARQIEVPSNSKILEIKHHGGNVTVLGWDEDNILIEGTKTARAETVDYARILMDNMEITAYERVPNRLVMEFAPPPIEWRVKDEQITIHYTAHIWR